MGMISFDIDGVLANFTRGFTRLGYLYHGTPVGDEGSQEEWDFEAFAPLQLDVTKTKKMWDHIKTDPHFWEDLDPFNPSIMRDINRIWSKMFITNRLGVEPHSQTERFLRKWGIDNPSVVVAAKKGPVAQEWGIVAHVDDYYKNCIEIKEAVPQCYVALLHVPYNRIHHDEMRKRGIDVVLSVDHFINNASRLGLVEW